MSDKAGGDNTVRRNWFTSTRKFVVLLGLGWLPAVLLFQGLGERGFGRDFDFAIIGVMFMFGIFAIPTLLLSVIVPTHKDRLVIVPLLLFAYFDWKFDRNSSAHPPSMVAALQWVVTFTAIALVIPEIPLVGRFYRRLLGLKSQ